MTICLAPIDSGQLGYVRRRGLGVAVAGVSEEMPARRWARLDVLLPGVLSRLILRRALVI